MHLLLVLVYELHVVGQIFIFFAWLFVETVYVTVAFVFISYFSSHLQVPSHNDLRHLRLLQFSLNNHKLLGWSDPILNQLSPQQVHRQVHHRLQDLVWICLKFLSFHFCQSAVICLGSQILFKKLKCKIVPVAGTNKQNNPLFIIKK